MQTVGHGGSGSLTSRSLYMSRHAGGISRFWTISSFSILLALVLTLIGVPTMHAQTTANLSGTVTDPTGSVIPGADVTLTNDATAQTRATVTNGTGDFSIPALLPGTYSVSIKAKGFQGFEQHGIVLDAGQIRKLTGLTLTVGSASQTVEVRESQEIIPTNSGEREAILDTKDIQNLALGSRDLSELLKVLPGVTTTPNGLSNGPAFNFTSVGAAGSAVGNGLVPNGVPNRGGTYQLVDGVDVDDPGCDCNSIALVDPDMTQEVTVETSNFGADAPYGPAVISSISKSGTAQYHGEGYFYARNDVLNANDWVSDHQGVKKGSAHYYYPGGNVGGPVPGFHKKLLFWGGYERLLQNTGNANSLSSFIPTPDMMAGNFTNTAANQTFCQGALTATQTDGCNDLTGTILPDGTPVVNSTIPSQFLDPGAKAMSSFWPKANANPATTPGGFNYFQIIPGIHDGWVYRLRVDYNLSSATQFYVSYQQGYDTQLSQGNGAHIYWTPYASIPYPGGGLYSTEYTKALAGHFLHTFSPTLTNEFIAAWGYGNFPVGPSNPKGAYRSTLGYPNYGTVFSPTSALIPSYNSAGDLTFPDFSQADIFENSSATYLVRKEMPSFADNVTKVWGQHTIKVGFFTENVGNIQGASTNKNGIYSYGFGGTLQPNIVTGQRVGSPNNPTANFFMGLASGYSENNIAPNSDMAYQIFAGYINDQWKVNKKLSVEIGARLDHQGHWYDRQKTGMAVFIPGRVASDYESGKFNPGVYWHALDPGIPNSGMPDRFAWVDPRFGMAYDVFGTGKTIVRGGWGVYRYSDQYNDYTGSLTTAQSILTYNLPSGHSIFLSQPGLASVPGSNISAPSTVCGPATAPGGTPCINGTVNALDGTNDTIPSTAAWNLTISQQLPLQSLFEIAYVGNKDQNIPVSGEAISGGGFTAFTDQNKIPLGAFFQPDPVTGVVSTNPENITATGNNQYADYHPYGREYGNNSVNVLSTAGYGNYNALQTSWVKRGANLNFNFNYTFAKALSTYLNEDAFNIHNDYGISPYNRTHVFNASGSYTAQHLYRGENHLVGGAVNGWTFSNITTFQSGGNLQALNNPNFGMSLQYYTPPATPGGTPTTSGLSQATYFGTNATITIQPLVTCNPTAGLANRQRIKYSCFAPPPIGTQGPRNYPYTMAPYFDSDIALYKTFHTVKGESVQFRASAFDFINHPLPQFSGGTPLTLHYNLNTSTGTFQTNAAQYPGGNPNAFGVMDTKSGAPNQRVIELAIKYMF